MQHTFKNLPIKVTSVAGLESCVEIPSWDLCFDIGRCPASAVSRSRVFFSHGHIDHMVGVTYHCGNRAFFGLQPPTYGMPPEYTDPFRRMLSTWEELDGSPFPHTIQEVRPGDYIPMGRNQSLLVLPAFHRIPAVGYALIEHRKRLKPEYTELPGSELGRLRKAGVQIEDDVETVLLAYTGDSTADIFLNPVVQAAQILITEVTFLDNTVPPESARDKGHVHLMDLVKHQGVLNQPHILAMHLSARHTGSDVEAMFRNVLPEELRSRISIAGLK